MIGRVGAIERVPVFCTSKEYKMVSATLDTLATSARLMMLSPSEPPAETVALASFDVVMPDVAVARLVTKPLVSSVWDNRYGALHTRGGSVGANGAVPQLMRLAILLSDTVTGSERVTFPVLVTV